jgi:hypothetical protein
MLFSLHPNVHAYINNVPTFIDESGFLEISKFTIEIYKLKSNAFQYFLTWSVCIHLRNSSKHYYYKGMVQISLHFIMCPKSQEIQTKKVNLLRTTLYK